MSRYQEPKIQGRERSCRSCSAPIVWLRTPRGAKMPCDAATVEKNDRVFDHRKHTSHFATCPNANQHRKRR